MIRFCSTRALNSRQDRHHQAARPTAAIGNQLYNEGFLLVFKCQAWVAAKGVQV